MADLDHNPEKQYLNASSSPFIVWSEDSDQQEISIDKELFISKMVHSNAIFEINNKINDKITLWNGNMLRLQVDAMVHPTNERFERCSLLTNALYQYAGPQLRRCLYNKVKYCPIGSIKITKGYSIIPHYVIHTASPHYKLKFHTASETALFNCYFNVLQAAKYYNIRTLAMGNLALKQHNYPEIDGIHLGIRVIRRFLESFPDAFDLIILCMENRHQYDLYRSVMRLYFPRNAFEKRLECYLLPDNNGGPMGEPIIPERAIRIQKNPIKTLYEINDSSLDSDYSYSSSYSTESEININECRERLIELNYQQEFDDIDIQEDSRSKNRSSSFVTSFVGHHSKTNDSDAANTINTIINDAYDSNDQLMINEHKQRLKFERLMRKTRHLDKELSDSIKERLNQSIYISGEDRQKRKVLTIVGYQLANLFQNEFNHNLDYILAHLLKLLEKVSREQYVVLYFHTLVDRYNLPKTQLLSRLYDYLSYQHRKNLRSFYIIHPSVFNRLYVWWLKTFHCKFLKNKIIFLQRMQHLENLINCSKHFEHLLPFITEFESTI